MGDEKALSSLAALLQEAEEFTIDVHDDFAELGILAEALHDGLKPLLPKFSDALEAAFGELDDAVVYGVYVEGQLGI